MDNITRINNYWKELYPDVPVSVLESFLSTLNPTENTSVISDWYKDAVVYALYVDLYNNDFNGLIDRLDYIQGIGVNCLWLLPVLKSPMRDAGFDISKYDMIRPELLGLPEDCTREEQEVVFGKFLEEAHSRGIRVIFDVAINHSSDQHPWFLESQKKEKNEFSDYYIWSDKPDKYLDARLLFKGIEDSNWEQHGDRYYFHRFFSFQPDLNYRNHEVLLAMTRNLLYWQSFGLDGFRADAIPYLWKEDGTACENLDSTHTIVKFFRAVLDYVKPGTLMLAEACQKPTEVVKYMGENDECHAAYHFPLMPMMYKAIAMGNKQPVIHTLSPDVTPNIGQENQWFTFLRVHDELSLELVYVSEEDREYIHTNYCHQPEWDFRIGEGISARLSELFKRDVYSIGLAYSMMLTLLGTPVVYYGDEFGKLNDEKFYKEQIKRTGKDDTRFLVRGRIDWEEMEKEINNPDSFHAKVYSLLTSMINTRNEYKAFGRGSLEFVDMKNQEGEVVNEVLSYERIYEDERMLVVNNLSDKSVEFVHPCDDHDLAVLHFNGFFMNDAENTMALEPHGVAWFMILED